MGATVQVETPESGGRGERMLNFRAAVSVSGPPARAVMEALISNAHVRTDDGRLLVDIPVAGTALVSWEHARILLDFLPGSIDGAGGTRAEALMLVTFDTAIRALAGADAVIVWQTALPPLRSVPAA